MIDPEVGFTSDVIKDYQRFVGRTDLIRSCMQGLNSPLEFARDLWKARRGKIFLA